MSSHWMRVPREPEPGVPSEPAEPGQTPEPDPQYDPDPSPVPWHDPGPPVRKVNLPPDSPTPGIPVDSPGREPDPG